jgi:flagellar biosynthesis anti-sigma factor FlgM
MTGSVDLAIGSVGLSNELLDMKVTDNSLSSRASAEALRTQQTGPTGQTASSSNPPAANAAASSDDIHLSELVRSLRSLAADSPERQARIEQIARSYASGTYQVDAQATASKIIDDAFQPS